MILQKEPFKIVLANNWFSKMQSIYFANYTPKETPWYLKILGFEYWWECKVVDGPEPEGDTWIYILKYVKTKLKWFKWTVKIIKV